MSKATKQAMEDLGAAVRDLGVEVRQALTKPVTLPAWMIYVLFVATVAPVLADLLRWIIG